MGSLLGKSPKQTYKGLIKIKDGDNQTIDTTLRALSDGVGTESALSLSTQEVLIRKLVVDDITIDGDTIEGATMDGGTF
jgi:hypothetical protein